MSPSSVGSITALIGPTGSGKSTFLRTLNRMNDRVPGLHAARVTSPSTTRASGRQHVDLLTLRRRVGMLFQRPNPFPMSIRDNVVAGVKAHRIAKGKQLDVVCERRLTEVGLWDAVKDRLNDSPFRLSGGQQQLLCLARALAVGPEVLLLDEPTSAARPDDDRVDRGACSRRSAPALTLIVVTHNLGQAMRVSHHTMFFYQGDLIEYGPTERLFNQPPASRHRALRHGSDGLEAPRCAARRRLMPLAPDPTHRPPADRSTRRQHPDTNQHKERTCEDIRCARHASERGAHRL